MRQNTVKMTTAQFAELHGVNRRTLHYYDDIGLFSPCQKGENGYRYYDASQSIVFEYIRMLKELNMSIAEIADYCKHPAPEKFLQIADRKEAEIDLEIRRLKRARNILKTKKAQVRLCEGLQDEEIRVEECGAVKISVLPYDFSGDDLSRLFTDLKSQWGIEQIRMGIGSFLSLDKVTAGSFETYDGLFTYSSGSASGPHTFVRPAGRYLCGYQKGPWDKAPAMYQKMIDYARRQHLTLTGFAYELGLNEFAISSPEEYVTKFMIQIDDPC